MSTAAIQCPCWPHLEKQIPNNILPVISTIDDVTLGLEPRLKIQMVNRGARTAGKSTSIPRRGEGVILFANFCPFCGNRLKGDPKGTDLIAAERIRQTIVEGYTEEHDAAHEDGELAAAAVAYAQVAHVQEQDPQADSAYTRSRGVNAWPWGVRDFKPHPQSSTRNLVKAGALIAAELDRIHRKNTPPAAAAETPKSN